jgi:hypothetical protein
MFSVFGIMSFTKAVNWGHVILFFQLYSNNHHVFTLKSFFFNCAGTNFAMYQRLRANPYENPNPIPIEKPFFPLFFDSSEFIEQDACMKGYVYLNRLVKYYDLSLIFIVINNKWTQSHILY